MRQKRLPTRLSAQRHPSAVRRRRCVRHVGTRSKKSDDRRAGSKRASDSRPPANRREGDGDAREAAGCGCTIDGQRILAKSRPIDATPRVYLPHILSNARTPGPLSCSRPFGALIRSRISPNYKPAPSLRASSNPGLPAIAPFSNTLPTATTPLSSIPEYAVRARYVSIICFDMERSLSSNAVKSTVDLIENGFAMPQNIRSMNALI